MRFVLGILLLATNVAYAAEPDPTERTLSPYFVVEGGADGGSRLRSSLRA